MYNIDNIVGVANCLTSSYNVYSVPAVFNIHKLIIIFIIYLILSCRTRLLVLAHS